MIGTKEKLCKIKIICCRVTRYDNFSYNSEETSIYKLQKFLYNFRDKMRLIWKLSIRRNKGPNEKEDEKSNTKMQPHTSFY